MSTAAQKLIIALDDLDEAAALAMVEKTKAYAQTYKVGLNLFCAYGPAIVKQISSLGVDIFLDLKLHDIPMQVAKAVETVLVLEPRFLTIHAAGGAQMLECAAQAASGSKTTLLAISVLTSLNQQDYQRLGFTDDIADGVNRLTDLAYASGIHGFVCSAKEAKNLKARFQNQCFLVCPGIRSGVQDLFDQARTLSAGDAIKACADALVVGRPITKAADAAAAAQDINRAINNGLEWCNEKK
jgi:orotidine-5'-phosphate decarboxylase